MPGTPHSGRRSKSRKAHVLAGTFRGDRHAELPSIEPPKGRPSQPKPLEGDGLLEWHRMLDRLEVCGTLAIVDDAAVFQYARLFDETERAALDKDEAAAAVKILEENIGSMTGSDLVACFQEISKMRRLVGHYTTQIRQGRMAIRQYLVEFGMTPSARSRVKSNPGPSKDDEQVELTRLLTIR